MTLVGVLLHWYAPSTMYLGKALLTMSVIHFGVIDYVKILGFLHSSKMKSNIIHENSIIWFIFLLFSFCLDLL